MEPIQMKNIILRGAFFYLKAMDECDLIPISGHVEDEEEEAALFPWPRTVPIRIINFVDEVIANYTDKQFQQDFRINRRTFEQLLPLIEDIIKKKENCGRMQIEPRRQLLAVIWILATPDSYRSVGQRFNMGKSSLSDSFIRIVKAINKISPRIIKWPQNTHETSERFYQMAGVEGVVGAVDGTFIVIKAPKEHPEAYITRKMDYAITLQGICDASMKFTDCFVGYPGSVSDTRIFRNSDIYHSVSENLPMYFPNNEFIVGDKAYPVLPWVMPPYIDRGNLTAAKRNFNLRISQTRQVIERCFALLFGRFRRLKFLDMNRLDLIPHTVMAACVLHNLCLINDDVYIADYIQEGLPYVRGNNAADEALPNYFNRFNQQEGHLVRDRLCNRLFQIQH